MTPEFEAELRELCLKQDKEYLVTCLIEAHKMLDKYEKAFEGIAEEKLTVVEMMKDFFYLTNKGEKQWK